MFFHLPHEHLDPQLLFFGFFFCGKPLLWGVRQGKEEIKFSPEETGVPSENFTSSSCFNNNSFHLLDYIILETKVAGCKSCARTKGVNQTL